MTLRTVPCHGTPFCRTIILPQTAWVCVTILATCQGHWNGVKNAVSSNSIRCLKTSTDPILDCGDASDVAASDSVPALETDCSSVCTGNASELCGGSNRISYYEWTGTPLWTFQYPTGNAMGEYQYGSCLRFFSLSEENASILSRVTR